MAGNVYKPKGTAKEKLTAIVIGHPSGGVKEQTAGVYAAMLAEKGYLTLTFDASYQGASGGEPRYLEDPQMRVEDVRCAVDYLTTRSDVDTDKIGALGMCASGGYVVNAAQTDLRIKAISTVSMADLGDMFRNGLGRTSEYKAALKQTLEQIAAQRTKEANGGETYYSWYVPPTAEQAEGLAGDYREGYEYYRVSPAKHPNSVNKMIFSRLDSIINFTALSHVEMCAPRPMLFIAGANAGTKYFSEEAYERVKETAELFIIDEATHIELYYKEPYVTTSVAKLDEFFEKTLGK
ncbi:MAG: alpha/beta hydrolase [Alphaproteobacteria bacterium]|nr:alpha/beta hydrolase [Alphaproteobacteria bacterium]